MKLMHSWLDKITHKIIPFLLSLLLITPVHAADLEKEKRMREQIIDYIMDGDAELLDTDTGKFLSIFMESESEPVRGAVIIMHGRGYHPNWPELVYPLRTGLPQHGWHTLSIQMPVLSNDSTFYDYLDILPEAFPRIDAAFNYLKQNDINNIVLLAHSCSVHMAVAWMENNLDKHIKAFVGVGMGSTDKGQPMLRPFPLEKFKFPILDIRGQLDYPAVIRFAPDRWQRMQNAGHPKSSQRVVKDADHYFTDMGDILLEEVSQWLNQL